MLPASMESQVNAHIPLAAKIAREFRDSPRLPHAEIEITAHEALARAAAGYDPQKGTFEAYAATAIRNALRDLRERQMLHHRQRPHPQPEKPDSRCREIARCHPLK